VREALSALKAEGLVDGDPHRGAVVFQPSLPDAKESMEIRIVLETLALDHAIPALREADFVLLQSLIDRMRRSATYSEWSALNETFHAELYAPAERPRLLELIATMRLASSYYIHLAVSDHLPNETADAQHQAILDACRSGDVEAGKAALRTHLERTAALVLEHLRDQQTAADPAASVAPAAG
jgi:DNA-binding GntR family transcriptional regulator